MAPIARTRTAPVRTLPGRYYHDPANFALEQARIFSNAWVCVGRADAILGPGDFFLTTLGAESVIVLRDRAGTLRAFLNVCRHRGARLCMEERGRLRASMQCRYHAWTYALDGSLIGAPNMKDDPDLDEAAFGLAPVAATVWEGLIWLHLGLDPAPLSEQLGSLYQMYDRYHLGALRVGATVDYDVQANWKLIVENFNECCHCAIAHPELSAQVPSFKAGVVTGVAGGAARFGEGIESLTTTGTTRRPPFRDLTAQDRVSYYGETLLPNVFLNLHPDYVVTHIMTPLAADRTRITCHWLFDPDVAAGPSFDPSDAVDFWDLVNRQDWEICELAQLGVHSRAYRDGGIYAPQERHIRAFNDYVLAHLGEETTWQ